VRNRAGGGLRGAGQMRRKYAPPQNGGGCGVRGACVVRGAWCVVRGAWCVVRGAWCVVRGAWCVVRGAVP
jgi:hypothetical protein